MVQSNGGPPGLPPTIIDVSVAAKWYLQEEEFAERALLLRAEMRAERAIVMAPDHVRYETAMHSAEQCGAAGSPPPSVIPLLLTS